MKRLISVGAATLLVLLSAPSRGASALASDSREHTTSASGCNQYSGNTRLVCMVVSQTSNRSTIASFMRVYAGPLGEKDPVFSRQLASAFDALASPATSAACISAMKELVIFPAIKQQSAEFRSKELLDSWRALNAVLDAFDYAQSLSDFGWRGPLLKRYFLDKIPSLSGIQKQWGEWAAKNAREFGNQNARHVISQQMALLIKPCPGRYDTGP